MHMRMHREVTVVTTPSPLTSVAILRDGYTLVAGGVDGKTEPPASHTITQYVHMKVPYSVLCMREYSITFCTGVEDIYMCMCIRVHFLFCHPTCILHMSAWILHSHVGTDSSLYFATCT